MAAEAKEEGEMDEDTLVRIEAWANAATPGPWHVERDGGYNFADARVVADEARQQRLDTGSDARPAYLALVGSMNDAEFVAAARRFMPALVAEVRRLRSLVPATAAPAEGE